MDQPINHRQVQYALRNAAEEIARECGTMMQTFYSLDGGNKPAIKEFVLLIMVKHMTPVLNGESVCNEPVRTEQFTPEGTVRDVA